MGEVTVVGIDVSPAKLDVAVVPGDDQFTVSNGVAGVPQLKARLLALAPTRVVLEATGKLERLAVSELGAAGLVLVLVNPAQVPERKKSGTAPARGRRVSRFWREGNTLVFPLGAGGTTSAGRRCKPTLHDG